MKKNLVCCLMMCFFLMLMGCYSFDVLVFDLVYDVLVVGEGIGGIVVVIQLVWFGVEMALVNLMLWYGGMLIFVGVSVIDGNYEMLVGLWGEFCFVFYDYYGGLEVVFMGWVSNMQFELYVGVVILDFII